MAAQSNQQQWRQLAMLEAFPSRRRTPPVAAAPP
jgi:hypothetical protein